jgi:hypothetical protein
MANVNTPSATVVVKPGDTGAEVTWTFGADGTTLFPGDDILAPINNNLRVTVQDQENDGWAVFNVVTDGANTLASTRLQREEFRVTTDQAGVPRIWNFDQVGRLNLPGNINGVYAGNTSFYAYDDGATGSVELKTISYVGDTLGSNVRVTQNNATISTANAAHTWTFDATGNLSAPGNIVLTGSLVGSGASPAPSLSGFSSVSAINVTATGNVTSGNFIGGGSNVDIVAGSHDWTFDNTGNLTLPGNTFAVNYANNTPVDVVTRFEGTWTVPVGNSTQSFTVTPNETYYLWVDCNIPNGILAWNATATVTNTNVPVVGAQYAWVYNGGGTPIDFTSIPNQFVGTANTIVRSNTAPSATTNRFDFGINNTSGGNVTVRYGYTRL